MDIKMQSEPGSYLMQHPPYSGVYEPVWGPNSISSLSFTNAEENFFGDFLSASSNHVIGSDFVDDVIMDPRFDSTSSMADFKYMPLNSSNEAFPSTPQCGGEFDPQIFNYSNPPQQNFPQQLYDLLPPFDHPGYLPEEPSDSDSGIHSPQPITSPTVENTNCWARRPDMQTFFPTPDYPPASDSACSRHNYSINTQDSQFLMNLDDKINYAVEPFITHDKFLMEAPPYSHHPNSIKSEQRSGETWPIQSVMSPLDMGHENVRRPQPVSHFNIPSSIQPNPQKITKRRQRQRRRKGADKEKTVHLWEFIRDILLEPKHCPSLMKWEDRVTGVFRFVKSDTVASMWGKKKQNPKMTYEKLSRAMRYYYNRGILERVDGRRLVYKFGPNAHGWRASDSHAESNKPNATKANSPQGDTTSATSGSHDVTSATLTPCKMENNEPADDVIDASSSGLLPSADVLLGRLTPHI